MRNLRVGLRFKADLAEASKGSPSGANASRKSSGEERTKIRKSRREGVKFC